MSADAMEDAIKRAWKSREQFSNDLASIVVTAIKTFSHMDEHKLHEKAVDFVESVI